MVRRNFTALLFILVASCSSPAWREVFIENPKTLVKLPCDEPLDKWRTSVTSKIALTAGATAKNLLKNVDTNGNISADVSAVDQQVRLVSRESFDYMSFLWPACSAHAQGIMDDQEYLKRMKELNDWFLREHPAPTVRFDRTADFSETKCVDGKRRYENVVHDTLTFSDDVKEYQAQALTTRPGHTVQVSYFDGQNQITPIPATTAEPTSITRKSVIIPVSGRTLKVTYVYTQEPAPDDDEWGLSFVSSLNIASIHATAILPVGKKVTGLNPKYDAANSVFKNCSFTAGTSPVLECKGSLDLSPNVPAVVVWQWDVFAGC